jgi:hypothetical protein
VGNQDCLYASLAFADYFPHISPTTTSLTQVHDWDYTPCDCFIWGDGHIDLDTGTGGCVGSINGRPVCKTEAIVNILSAPLESEDGVRLLFLLFLALDMEIYDFTHSNSIYFFVYVAISTITRWDFKMSSRAYNFFIRSMFISGFIIFRLFSKYSFRSN